MMWIKINDAPFKGGIVVGLSPNQEPAPRVREYVVPGRSGTLTRWLGDYETTNKEIKIVCDVSRVAGVISDLDGAKSIECSDAPGRVLSVYRTSEITQEPLNPTQRLVAVAFTVQPNVEVT